MRLSLVVLIVGLVLAACSPSRDRVGERPSGETVDVRVTLVEFAIMSARTTFVSGQRYRFVVTNEGTLPHELLVVRPARPGLPWSEEMRAGALGVIEARNLPPGSGYVLNLVFDKPYPSGSLEFACHILGHYEAGQHLPIIVS